MRTYFRLVFIDDGWGIEYKNSIFRAWKRVVHKGDTTIYRIKKQAEDIITNLINGESCEDWFNEEEEKPNDRT